MSSFHVNLRIERALCSGFDSNMNRSKCIVQHNDCNDFINRFKLTNRTVSTQCKLKTLCLLQHIKCLNST